MENKRLVLFVPKFVFRFMLVFVRLSSCKNCQEVL